MLSFHYSDHDLPLWDRGIATKEVVETQLRPFCVDQIAWEYMHPWIGWKIILIDLESHKDIDSAYVIRVLYIIAHLGYPTAQVVTGAYNSIQEGTCRHEHT